MRAPLTGSDARMEPQPVERRIHTVYVTRNTEYHVRAGVCVAVREREEDVWRDDHPAVGRSLAGALRWLGHGVIPHSGAPREGDAIYFRRGERDLITSKVVRVERPSREVVARYPKLS